MKVLSISASIEPGPLESNPPHLCLRSGGIQYTRTVRTNATARSEDIAAEGFRHHTSAVFL